MSSWESYLTPQELNEYTQYFRAASRSQNGIVTGAEAVQFFATSGVPNQILSTIWEAADRDNVGHLTPETFAIALKMIACAQHGYEVTEPVLSTSVPLPQFEGLKLDNNQNLGNNSPAIGTQQLQQHVDGPAMKLTPTEREKYISIFRVQQPVDGLLDASNAKSIFMKSKLSNETLGQIWNLADVRQAGNMNQTEFAIAMHYIAKLMDGTLSTLPTQLPTSVYATANGDTNNTIVQPSPRPLAATASSHIPPQQQRSQTIDSLGSMAFSGNDPVTTASSSSSHWDVTPQEKVQFDTFFDKIDTQRTGFVQGGETVEFFKNSRLPENDLAHIWDLADSGQQGRLTRDQFAVAMHLIHKRLKGDMLPNALPQSLIPPSPHPQAAASPAMMAAPLQHQQSTGISVANIQSPAVTGGNVFDDQDLLGDFGNNDQLTQDTNQVNQLQNQMSALKTSTGQIQGQKLDTQQTLERLSQQKQELQAQLAQVQMQHEAELKELKELQQQLENEKPGFIQATQDHEAAQQQLQTTQNEVAQLQQALEHGRSESERLRQNVRTIQEETQKLVNDLNALRSQVKQQNMMMDINRRQVTASEQDRDQAKRDLADFKEERGLPEDIEILHTTEEFKSPEAHATTEAVASPGTSSLASNNNFFDAFSPQSQNAEPNTGPSVPATTSPTPVNDFDAIFGNFGTETSPVVETKPQHHSPLSAFDPIGWTTPPESSSNAGTSTNTTKSSRPAPPPPPPQSRHHRQTSDQSHVSTPANVTATKKPRAPPPPPPANKSSASSITSPTQQQQSFANNVFGSDDFDAAFSGQLNEAQVVQTSEPTKTDGFDDAFGVFDDKSSSNNKEDEKEESKIREEGGSDEQQRQKKASGNDLNWATGFGGFEFNEESKEKKTTNEEDDWDSIFGGSSTITKGVSPEETKQNTQTITADKDAFIGFEDAFNSSFDVSATPAEKTTTKDKNETVIPSSGNSNLDELLKMGFGQKEAKNALDRYDQDLTKASNFLLDQTTK